MAKTKDDFTDPGFGWDTIDPTPPDVSITNPDPNNGLWQIPQDPTLGATPFTPLQGTPDLSSLPGGASSAIGSLLRGLGLANGSGGMNPLAWLSVLGPLLGGIMANRATGRATDQMLAANRDAANFLQQRLGTFGPLVKPYTDAGAAAVGRLNAQAPANLASNFRPLGSGRAIAPGSTLAQIMNGGH